MTGETTVRNENRDSWWEWVGSVGHRLGQKGQRSHLIQYWNREGTVIISEIETPKLRRWRGGCNGQACCPKSYPATSFLKIFNPPAPIEWNPSHLGWFGGLSNPGPLTSPCLLPSESLTFQSPCLLVLFPQPDKPFQFSILRRSYSSEKSLLQYCLSHDASFWSLKSEPWTPPPRLMPCIVQSIQGRPGPQPWPLSSCPYECDLLSLQSQHCPTLSDIS